ncbi:MAG: pyrC [Phycisphaerales bacterium]|nr:pyrC [Phycisphaerales bacterium]
MPTLLIQNGTILDPSTNTQEKLDLLIENGRITQRAAGYQPATKPDQIIDAVGKLVAPGLIDVHVHFREPGDEEEETIASGAAAAVAGGFTTVCVMPNTKPAIDNAAQIEFVLRESERLGLCNVLPTGSITKHRDGSELAEMADMHRRGAVAFTDDGAGVNDVSVMRKAFQYIKMFDGLVMQHCEDEKLAGGAMHAGVVSTSLGLPGLPAEAEQLMIARDVLLNRTIGCRYHVQHISTAFSVELIRRAKKDGLPVTAEVAPHHLLLTDEDCRGYDTNFKMNPPLRTAVDVAACIQGVVDGTIDILATDHAPHRAEEKELEFAKAPNGIIGLEGAMALYAQALVTPGHITWMKLIDLMSTAPAKLIRSTRGTLQVGRAADITIIDPDVSWTIDKTQFKSKSRNCPFHGRQVKGRATHTIVNGRVVWAL